MASPVHAQEDTQAQDEPTYLYEHVSDKDIDLTAATTTPRPESTNPLPHGVTGHGDIIWVSDFNTNTAYAFNIGETSFGTPAATSTIELHKASYTIPNPWRGGTITENLDRAASIWTDGTHMWVRAESTADTVVDPLGGIWKIEMSTGAAVGFWALDRDNSIPGGIWSDGTTMWVLDRHDDKVYAYNLGNGTRDKSKEFSLRHGHDDAVSIWSDGTTMWLSDYRDNKAYAYNLSTGRSDYRKHFNLASGNNSAAGLWSNGTTMWVVEKYDVFGGDGQETKLFAYAMTGEKRTGGV